MTRFRHVHPHPLLHLILPTLLLLLLPQSASAHGTPSLYADVIVESAVEATVSVSGVVQLEPEAGCMLEPPAAKVMRLRCPQGIAGRELTAVGLGVRGEALVVRMRAERGEESSVVITASSPRWRLPGDEGVSNLLARYTRVGLEHVLGGADHLLLLLALFWGAEDRARGRGLRPLVRALLLIATTFTVAHSLSLAATALGWLSVPSAPAEAMIALSLVLVALDLCKPQAVASTPIVAAFGLVHGLGFASGLAEVGLPRESVALGLVAFNVGVELAQLLVLTSCVGLVLCFGRVFRGSASALDGARALSAYAIGVTGVALFLLRTTSSFI